MALRFNPPPNWPAPPEGFVPPAGWQPDPSWGPAPEGWQLWIDDSAPAAEPGGVAPTQAISTNGPSGFEQAPAAGSAPSFGGPAPAAGSAPSFGGPAPAAGSAPSFGGPAPAAGPAPAFSASAPSAGAGAPADAAPSYSSSPYAANLDYAQAPTPYHSAPGQQQPSGWQPVDVHNGGQAAAKPVTKQWWFWTIILVVVLALVGMIILIVSLSGGKGGSSDPTSTAAQTASAAPSADASKSPGSDAPANSKDGVGTTLDNPADPTDSMFTFKADKYADDPESYVEVGFGQVEWDANDAVKAAQRSIYEPPESGKQYMRVPVTLTYHGKGKFSSFSLRVDYVKDGNTVSSDLTLAKDDFSNMDMPRDGGTVTGYFTFQISSKDANSGVFAVSALHADELYVQAK